MKHILILLISFFLLISLTNCSICSSKHNYDRTYKYQQKKSDGKTHKSFNVSSNGLLNVQVETGGSIKVTGWNKNIVDVKIYLSGRDKDNVDVKIKKNGNDVLVETELIEETRNKKLNCKIVVKVPFKYNVDFSTMGGSVYFKDIQGEFTGKTMGGELELENLKGIIDMSTMGGSISAINSDIDGDLSTMGGSVDLDNLIGNVNAKTMGGNIHHDVKKRTDGSGSKNKMTIETMGGDIDITNASYGAKVETMGGNIRIKKARKFIQANTMGGNIRIDEIDGWVKTKTMGGNIKCTVVGSNKGEKNIYLTSMGGDIELYVPDNFSADIDIEIRYDKREEGDFEIVSDFDIDTEIERKNRTLIGTGKAGSGKHKITIRTVGGNVYLKKK